jgi:hypothetical protein
MLNLTIRIKSLPRIIIFCLTKPNILCGFARATLRNIPANPNLALINGTIIAGTGAVIQNGVLLIKGNRIEKVGEGQALEVPEGYRTIDLHGRTVLPGFFNTHVRILISLPPELKMPLMYPVWTRSSEPWKTAKLPILLLSKAIL